MCISLICIISDSVNCEYSVYSCFGTEHLQIKTPHFIHHESLNAIKVYKLHHRKRSPSSKLFVRLQNKPVWTAQLLVSKTTWVLRCLPRINDKYEELQWTSRSQCRKYFKTTQWPLQLFQFVSWSHEKRLFDEPLDHSMLPASDYCSTDLVKNVAIIK